MKNPYSLDTIKLKLLVFVCFVAFTTNTINGQQKLIDSLENVLKESQLTKHDRLRTINLLAKYYIAEDKDESYALADDALRLAREQSDTELKLAAYVNKILVSEMQDSIEVSYYMIDTCTYLVEQIGDVSTKGEALMNIAAIKHRYKDETDVLPMIFKALDVAKAIKDKELEIKIYYFLSSSYYSPLRDVENFDKYSSLAEQAAVEIKNADVKVLPYLAEGALYRLKFINDRSTEAYLDSSIVFLKKGIELCQSNEGYVSSSRYLNALGHLISTYTFQTFNRNDSTFYVQPDSIYKYSKIMLNIAQTVDNPYFITVAYDFLSGYESNRKNFSEAENILIKALDVLKDTDKNNYIQMKHQLCLSLVYQLRINKKHQKALDYMEEAYMYQELLFKNKYIRDGQITEAKYRLKENEKELLLSQQEANRHKKRLIGSVLGAMLLIVILFVFHQMRLRNAKQKAELHEKENEEMRLNALIKEKELQRSESEKRALLLEKELEEEKAQRQALEINRLHTELIAGISQLSTKSKTLDKIKQKLDVDKQLAKEEIKDLLLTDKIADKSFDDFSDLLQKVHPDFFSKLQEHANQKLTSLDLKYCTYILMDFSSKEIANIMHVESKTARSTKYRLKQKLTLSKEDDLTLFIKNIARQLPSL